jgi:tRNA(Ile)-lysidine synthase
MTSGDAQAAVKHVPPGAWAVAVSGGADSMALLALLRERRGLSLHVVHLDHESRQGQSAVDARFVQKISDGWGLQCTIARRGDIEKTMGKLPRNRAARYRAVRMELFARVVAKKRLLGVILGHHADDQAETVLQRLLRGSGLTGLRGMQMRASLGGLTVLRPLLEIRRQTLRAVLSERGIAWREDASNLSMDQQRNRVRRLLADDPRLTEAMLRLRRASARWVDWLESRAPSLECSFAATELAELPPMVAEFAARRWLGEQSHHRREIPAQAAARLVEMASDAASPSRQSFPGGFTVRRRAGRIFAEDSTGAR